MGMDWSHEETILSHVQIDAITPSIVGLDRFQTLRNNSQQHPANNMQQGVQTDATCKIQQCYVHLHGALDKVLSVDDYRTGIFG